MVFFGIFGTFVYMLLFKRNNANGADGGEEGKDLIAEMEKSQQVVGKIEEGRRMSTEGEEGAEVDEIGKRPQGEEKMKKRDCLNKCVLVEGGGMRLAGSGDRWPKAASEPTAAKYSADSETDGRESGGGVVERLVGLTELANSKLVRSRVFLEENSFNPRPQKRENEGGRKTCSSSLTKLDGSNVCRRVLPPDPILNGQLESTMFPDALSYENSESDFNEDESVPAANAAQDGPPKSENETKPRVLERDPLATGFLEVQAKSSTLTTDFRNSSIDTVLEVEPSHLGKKAKDNELEKQGTRCFQDSLFDPSKSKIFDVAPIPLCELTKAKLLESASTGALIRKRAFDIKKSIGLETDKGVTNEEEEYQSSGSETKDLTRKPTGSLRRNFFSDPILELAKSKLTERCASLEPSNESKEPSRMKSREQSGPPPRNSKFLPTKNVSPPPRIQPPQRNSVLPSPIIVKAKSSIFNQDATPKEFKCSRVKSLGWLIRGTPESPLSSPDSEPKNVSHELNKEANTKTEPAMKRYGASERRVDDSDPHVRKKSQGKNRKKHCGGLFACSSCVKAADTGGCHRPRALIFACLERRKSSEMADSPEPRVKKSCRRHENTRRICTLCLQHLDDFCSDCCRPIHANCLDCRKPIEGTCKKGYHVYKKLSVKQQLVQ